MRLCMTVVSGGDERKDNATDSFGIRKIQNLQTQIYASLTGE